MSRFLKFIVHFVVLCTIACVVALAVPPFYGVETVIIDDSSKVTNLELGSVTYAIPANINEVIDSKKKSVGTIGGVVVGVETFIGQKIYQYMKNYDKSKKIYTDCVDAIQMVNEYIKVKIQDVVIRNEDNIGNVIKKLKELIGIIINRSIQAI